MSEINLLPDELRDKEEKELDSLRKKPKRISIDMSSPKRQRVDQPLRAAKPSLVSRLFSRNIKPGDVAEEVEDAALPSREEVSPRQVEKKINLSGGDFGIGGAKEAESEIAVEAIRPESYERKRGASFGVGPGEPGNLIQKPREEIKVTSDFGQSQRDKAKKPFVFSLFSRKKKGAVKMSDAELDKMRDKSDDRSERKTTVDVNLIPEEFDSHLDLNLSRKFSGFIAATIAGVMVVLVVYIGVIVYQANLSLQIKGVEKDIAKLDTQLAALENQRKEALEFQDYLQKVRDLLNNHVYWTKFFGLFEKHTHQQVYYSNFSMAGKSSLVISATGQDYNTVAEQLVELQKADDFAKNVVINAAQLQTGVGGAINGVGFTISLELWPEVFLKPIDDK